MISLIIASLIVIFDQITKYGILDFLRVSDIEVAGKSMTVIDGVLNFTYVKNYGVGFGALSDKRWLFMAFSSILIFVIFFAVAKYHGRSKLFDVILGLLLGGGVGNMIDRIRLGFVIDFIDVTFLPFWKWVFNVADCAVTIGGILLVVYLLFFDKIFVKQNGEKHEQ